MPVEDKITEEDIEFTFEDIICEICNSGDNEDSLLLCDHCDKGYHTNCIGIIRVPYLDKWFCSQCIIDQPEMVQNLQRQEIMNARQPELPCKRSRRNCRSSKDHQRKLRRSERLKNTN